MTLTSGTKLGPYEVVAPAGAGGMGEVYRARDTRLNRDVAVKILPAAFARDPERTTNTVTDDKPGDRHKPGGHKPGDRTQTR
jgi:serine/threonine protein kinase